MGPDASSDVLRRRGRNVLASELGRQRRGVTAIVLLPLWPRLSNALDEAQSAVRPSSDISNGRRALPSASAAADWVRAAPRLREDLCRN